MHVVKPQHKLKSQIATNSAGRHDRFCALRSASECLAFPWPWSLLIASVLQSMLRECHLLKRNERVASHFRKIFEGFTDSFASEQNDSNIFMPTIRCPLRASGNAWSAMTGSRIISSNEHERWLPSEEVAFVVHFFSPLDVVIATHRSNSKVKFVKNNCSFFFHERTDSKFPPLCVEVPLKKKKRVR